MLDVKTGAIVYEKTHFFIVSKPLPEISGGAIAP